MTDWGTENPISLEDLKNAAIDLGDSYWVLHSNPSFNGDVGILHFTDGHAAYAPWYIKDRNRADWFQDDGLGGLELNPEGRVPPLWILLWCWVYNGFTVLPMNGGEDEFDELIPTESP